MWFLKNTSKEYFAIKDITNKKYAQSYSQLHTCISFFRILNIHTIFNNKLPRTNQFGNINFPTKLPKYNNYVYYLQ